MLFRSFKGHVYNKEPIFMQAYSTKDTLQYLPKVPRCLILSSTDILVSRRVPSGKENQTRSTPHKVHLYSVLFSSLGLLPSIFPCLLPFLFHVFVLQPDQTQIELLSVRTDFRLFECRMPQGRNICCICRPLIQRQ